MEQQSEKGWNTELDGEFHKHDPPKRRLYIRGVILDLKPCTTVLTVRTRSTCVCRNLYAYGIPSGLYDGGHGAGLWDYWEMMRKHRAASVASFGCWPTKGEACRHE